MTAIAHTEQTLTGKVKESPWGQSDRTAAEHLTTSDAADGQGRGGDPGDRRSWLGQDTRPAARTTPTARGAARRSGR